MILDSIDKITLNQHSYLELLNELTIARQKALLKVKKEDPNVKKFIESKLYKILKSNIIKDSNKYDYYLKSLESYKDCIVEEVFDILMKEGQ